MSLPAPDSRTTRLLVLWYGIYQAAHVAVNARGLILMLRQQPLDFPAPPPPEGWLWQTTQFLIGLASVDLIGALLALIFVVGYFRRASWRMPLGTIALTISLDAAAVFNYGTWTAGAWTDDNLWAYTSTNLFFLPVVALAVFVYYWSLGGAVNANQ